MAIKAVRSLTVLCDYCGSEYGRPGEYESASSARAGAGAAGWKTISIKQMHAPRLADSCPDCLETCSSCHGAPPAGYTCNTCGLGGPTPITRQGAVLTTQGRCAECGGTFAVKVNGKLWPHKNPKTGFHCTGTRLPALPIAQPDELLI